jgi:hypothetical protein
MRLTSCALSARSLHSYRANVDKRWQQEVFFEPTDTSTYGKNKFFKLDLDANGLNDLVVNWKKAKEKVKARQTEILAKAREYLA